MILGDGLGRIIRAIFSVWDERVAPQVRWVYMAYIVKEDEAKYK